MRHATWSTSRRTVGVAVLLALGLSVAATLEAGAADKPEARDRFTIPATDDGLAGAGPIRRYEWFQQVWRERRSAWARQVDQDQHAVVFLGDSITQGWGGGLGAAFPGIKVANRGISGDTTRGVLLRLQEDVLVLNPAAVVLLIGTNDLEEGATPEEGFESLFNGHDLTGWGYRPTSEADKASAKRWQASDPDAAAWPFVTEPVSFEGLTVTPDGRFAAINGRLVVTTPPEYRKIQQLWSTREFPRDFVLKLEFRATPNADSGVYLRGPQLQCRDYRLAGPYKELKRYRPQDWNELVVTVQGGVAHCTCNAELLEAALALPGTGPIGVEGDRGQMEYRRIRIKVLSR